MTYVFVCPTCSSRNTLKSVPDGLGGGDWVCAVCGHFFGGWIDDGALDIGITRIDPPGENNLEFFSEQFSHTVEEPVDIAVGEVIEQEP